MDAFWIILTGSFVASSCAILGCYLVLRQMAMVGDAISHAVLPGIVIAFLLTGSRESLPMVLGAGALGIITTFLIQFMHQQGKLQEDASIGITFTWLFALGIIMISSLTEQVDLDQDCVLYGEIAYVPLDMWITQGGLMLGPRPAWTTGVILLLIIVFISFGYRSLFVTTFDPGFARSIGISLGLWHYLLMGAVSFTTVASFEVVGAILVVAFLIAPPATAYLLTDNFRYMLFLSVLFGIIASIGGYYLAAAWNASISGSMASVAGILFGLSFLFSPKYGRFKEWVSNH